MKRLYFFAVILMVSITISADGLEEGYHGYIDLGYGISSPQSLEINEITLSTSHGYQFSPYVFLGGGLMLQKSTEGTYGDIDGKPFMKRDSKMDIPMFVNGRFNFTSKKISPYVDLKAGYYLNNNGKEYYSVAIGCRYALPNNKGCYLELGCNSKKLEVEEIMMTTVGYKLYYSYTPLDENFSDYFLKIGFDF